MPAPHRAIWEWIDNAGGFLRASSWVDSSASTGTLEVELQTSSNANLEFVTIAAPTISAGAPGSGQYNLVTDVAQLLFATVPGTTIKVIVPGPLATTFGPDSNVVNPLDPNVAALIAAVIGTLTDAAGNLVTAYVSGVKTSRRTEQV